MPNPQPPENDNQQPQPRPVRWVDVRFNGSLVCRVNADDPTHIQLMVRLRSGKRGIFEVSTTAARVTGL